MALVSAGIIAGTTALSWGTAAAAAVEVGVAVAVTGLTLKVVGTVTRNKGLAEAGGQMSMAGAAIGIVGAGVGFGAGGAEAGFTPFADAGYGVDQAGLHPAVDFAQGGDVVAEQGVAGQLSADVGGVADQSTLTGDGGAKAALDGFKTTPTPGTEQATDLAPEANVGPPDLMQPPLPKPGVESSFDINSVLTPDQQAAQTSAGWKTVMTSNPLTPGDGAGWWAKLPESTKAMLALTAGQTGAGAAGGFFQGMQAEDQLELQRQIVKWKQSNASFAPRVTGMINTRRRT